MELALCTLTPLPCKVAVRPHTSGTAAYRPLSSRGRLGRGRRCISADASAVIYSTSTGHTAEVAGMIQAELGADEPQDVADIQLSDLASYEGIVVGCPTWNTGADEARSGTAWDDVLEEIKGLDLNGKPVAVFGLGDQISYADYFCDAMEEVYSTFKAAGANMVGHWPAKDYEHEDSKALLDDGNFCGLPLDQDNEFEKTEGRVKAWAAQLKNEGMP